MANDPWVRQSLVILRKELDTERRTGAIAFTTGLFAICALLLVTLATARLSGVRVTNALSGLSRPAWGSAEKLCLAWVVVCFAAFTSLSHTFLSEEETGSAVSLKLSVGARAVYAGKFAFNLVVVLGTAAVITPVYALLTGMSLAPLTGIAMVTIGGSIGLAAAATFTSAVAARARGTSGIYAATGLPFTVGLLLLLSNAAESVYTIGSPVATVRALVGLLAYGVLVTTVALLVFPAVWDD